ncbi:hypothetical protein [Rubripirellula lacrimiformis]|uniref:hypothetical protein n=1 Tax=Rubripirellula lacrimiformis TaxID=1930273 RepID=UPI001C54F2FE|nr:hypothetical protein [Rubripirellula lacrimiformis]
MARFSVCLQVIRRSPQNPTVIRLKAIGSSLAKECQVSSTNPYASASQALSKSRSQPKRTLPMRRAIGSHVAAFFCGCIIGTEVAYSMLLGGTLFGESILLQQPLAMVAQNLATWLIASLCIAVTTFMLFPPRFNATALIRGTVAGLVFAFPMFGVSWLSMYLAQRGSGLPVFLVSGSLTVRYICYTVAAICFDFFACALYRLGRRITIA